MGSRAPDEASHDEETPWVATWDEHDVPRSDNRFTPASGFSQGTYVHNITAHNTGAATEHTLLQP